METSERSCKEEAGASESSFKGERGLRRGGRNAMRGVGSQRRGRSSLRGARGQVRGRSAGGLQRGPGWIPSRAWGLALGWRFQPRAGSGELPSSTQGFRGVCGAPGPKACSRGPSHAQRTCPAHGPSRCVPTRPRKAQRPRRRPRAADSGTQPRPCWG